MNEDTSTVSPYDVTAHLLTGVDFTTISVNASTPKDWTKVQDVPYAIAMYVFVMCTMAVLGLVGNGLSIAVLKRDTTHSMFLLQVLAYVDSAFLIACVVFLSFRHIVYHTSWFHISARKQFAYVLFVVRPLWYTTHVASVWMVVLVTVSRYVAVCKPLKADLFSARRTRLAAAGVLLASVAYNIPLIVSQFLDAKTLGYRLCVVIYHVALRFLCVSIGPLIVLLVLNILIIRTVGRAVRQRHAITSGQDLKSTSNRHQDDLTKMVIVVVTVFIACQVTYLGWRSADTALRFGWIAVDASLHYHFLPITDTLLVLNSSVNFVIYCLVGKKFRRLLRDVFRDCCGRIRMFPTSHSHSTSSAFTRSTKL